MKEQRSREKGEVAGYLRCVEGGSSMYLGMVDRNNNCFSNLLLTPDNTYLFPIRLMSIVSNNNSALFSLHSGTKADVGHRA